MGVMARWRRRRKTGLVLLAAALALLSACINLAYWSMSSRLDYTERALQWMTVAPPHYNTEASKIEPDEDAPSATALYARAYAILEQAMTGMNFDAAPTATFFSELDGWSEVVDLVKRANALPYEQYIPCEAPDTQLVAYRADPENRMRWLTDWMDLAARAALSAGDEEQTLFLLEQGLLLSSRLDVCPGLSGTYARQFRDEDFLRTYLSLLARTTVESSQVLDLLSSRDYRGHRLAAWRVEVFRDNILPPLGESWHAEQSKHLLMPRFLLRVADCRYRQDILTFALVNLPELKKSYYQMQLKTPHIRCLSADEVQEYRDLLNGVSLRTACMEAAVVVCRAATYARLYRARNGKYPASLADWIDPVTGRPIEYEQRNGSILIRTGGRDRHGNPWEFRCD